MDLIQKIEAHKDTLETDKVKIIGVAKEGIALKITIPADIDILDFIEEVGQYFYKIDNPIFGQKFVSNETKDYIYHWLIELFNTGNYEEMPDKSELILNLEIDFEKVGTFKFALQKYASKLYNDKQINAEQAVIFAEEIAIDILNIIEEIRQL